ncbi:MAG: cytochrome c3 family protein, partial [Planctomycetota bacterium]
GDDPIVNPSKLSVERANHVCGQCHAEGEMIVPGYRPGNDLFEYIDVHGLEDDRHLLPDGRANELIHNLVPTMESRCGPLVCSKCHDPHGRGIPGLLIRPLEDDWMCLQCHGETAEHSHHPEGSEGRRCVGCHMPQMVIEGGHGRIYDHTVSIPSMRNTKDLGLPNACRNCHLEQSPGWEFEPFEKWYPGAEDRNHRNGLAKAVAGGRSGDAGALEALRALAKEKNAIYRAGAFWPLSRFDVDLRRGLEDPHPMVRRAAIQGVAKRDPDALGQVLEGPSMVLRHAAASALAGDFDRMRSDPDLRSRVLAVLTSCAKLRPDRARLHYLLGALHEIGDDRPRALRAYERYLRINPWDRRIAAHTETLR